MAIFNSYVKLPEGKHKRIWSKRGKWCLTLRINQFGRADISWEGTITKFYIWNIPSCTWVIESNTTQHNQLTAAKISSCSVDFEIPWHLIPPGILEQDKGKKNIKTFKQQHSNPFVEI